MKKPWDPGFKRNKSTSTVGEAMGDMLKAYKIERKFSQTAVLKGWDDLVGPVIAKRTTKVYFNKNVLVVQIDSAPLRSELNYNKTKLLQALQNKFGREIVANLLIS